MALLVTYQWVKHSVDGKEDELGGFSIISVDFLDYLVIRSILTAWAFRKF